MLKVLLFVTIVAATALQAGGQDAGGASAGAAAATDPSAILTQLQIQNVFTPESYDSSGYKNNFIIQPVLPFPVAVPHAHRRLQRSHQCSRGQSYGVRVGKVTEIGRHKVNIFVEAYFTPDGLRKGPAEKWGVKFNVTFLFPDKKFGPLIGHLSDGCDGSCCCEQTTPTNGRVNESTVQAS